MAVLAGDAGEQLLRDEAELDRVPWTIRFGLFEMDDTAPRAMRVLGDAARPGTAW